MKKRWTNSGQEILFDTVNFYIRNELVFQNIKELKKIDMTLLNSASLDTISIIL